MTAVRRPPAVVKINAQTHAKLQEIAREDDRPMGEIVTFLVDRYERERFWKGAKEDLARLKADPVAWQDYQDEIAVWDSLAGSGLENEPPYFTPQEEEEIRERAAARAAVR